MLIENGKLGYTTILWTIFPWNYFEPVCKLFIKYIHIFDCLIYTGVYNWGY